MAINPSFLIAAPMLQDSFVDPSTGEPLSGGLVKVYSDTNRMFFKNWYYQTGSFGSYTYSPLDNPLTLSAGGTITDPSGTDTIPFFYPYSENNVSNGQFTSEVYFIEVYDSLGTLKFTRENFPFIASNNATTQETPTLENLIVNKEFWRNQGTVTLTNPPATISGYFPSGFNYAQTLAPSQHNGFLMPDMQFIKNVQGATETCTFNKFNLGSDPIPTSVQDIAPEYYVNHNCSIVQVGETLKVYQWPISLHLQNLQGSSGTATIWLQNVTSSVNLQLYIFQHAGSGVASAAPVPIGNPIILNSGLTTWTKYSINFTFPSAVGVAVSAGSDDAFYLQLGLPLSSQCNFNFFKPSLYLSTTIPTNDLWTYDKVDTYINNYHTGDTKHSFGDTYDAGWVPANDGTIGTSASNAVTRANADTWPLYSLIWNKVANNNLLYAPIFTSAGVISTLGSNSYADFNANKQLTLGRILGQVIAGSVPSYSPSVNFTNDTATPSILTVGSGTIISNGLGFAVPIIFTTTGTLPASLALNTIYYCVYVDGLTLTSSQFVVSETLDDAIAGNYLTLTDTGTGTHSVQINPFLSGYFQGQIKQKLLVAQLPSHTHTVGGLLENTGNQIAGGSGWTQSGSYTTDGGTGGNGYHNNMQPTTFLNTYIKL